MTSFPKKAVENLALVFPDAIFYQPTNHPVVALTIDDVPVPGESAPCSTRWILDAIADHNQQIPKSGQPVHATFFIIGSHLNRDEALLADMVAQGHEIANHGYVDTWPALQSLAQFQQEFVDTHRLIAEQVPDQLIRWYRPGRAFYNPQMLKVLRSTVGYEPYFALASMVPLDTLSRTAEPTFTARYVAQHVFPGAILLLHGGSAARSRNTAAALRLILPQLRSRGYQVTTLSDLMLRAKTTAQQ